MVIGRYLNLFDIFSITVKEKALSNDFSTCFGLILVNSNDQIGNILVTLLLLKVRSVF